MYKFFPVFAALLTGCAVYPVQPIYTEAQPSVVVPSPVVVQQPVVVAPPPIYRPPVVYPRPIYRHYHRPCCGGGVYYRGPNVSIGVRY